MNRPVVVTGVGRSGTSLVAGMLHRLGVSMGDDFVPADRANPAGYWEDQIVVDVLRLLMRGGLDLPQSIAELSAHFQRRDAEHERWGCKSALFATPLVVGPVLDAVAMAFPRPPLLVVVGRHQLDAAASFRAAYGMDGSSVIRDRMRGIMAMTQRRAASDVICLDYERALAEPEGAARRLDQSLALGASASAIEHAAAFCDRSLSGGGAKLTAARDGRTDHVTMQGGALP